MKIAVIIPNVGMKEAAVRERESYLARIARPGTRIDVHVNTEGPASIESEAERDWASVTILQRMRSLEAAGYDAFVPWCASDPAVQAAREHFSVPVVGPLQASCLIAASLGFRFSVIMPRGNARMMRERVASFGLRERLAGVREIDATVLELRVDLDATRAMIADAMRAAVADGADAAALACMGLFGVAESVKGAIPLVDPARAAIGMAENLVAMGLSHSPIAYAA